MRKLLKKSEMLFKPHAGPTLFHSTAIGLSQKLRSLMERRHLYLAKPVKDIGEQISPPPFFQFV